MSLDTQSPGVAFARGVHLHIDPLTGNCSDCGARREEMDDNLAPMCTKFEGPNRLALKAIDQQIADVNSQIGDLHRRMEAADRTSIACDRQIREAEARKMELVASMEALKQ